MSDQPKSEFEKATAGQSYTSLLRESWDFLRSNKKWWLLPVLMVLLVFGLLLIISGTAAASFIYTLF
jgi:hypothetical protein